MPSSTILHAACFAVGALVGGGVATAIGRNNTVPRPVPMPVPTSESVKEPIVGVQLGGAPKLSTPGTLIKAESQLLEYGHPGPISDLLVRKAYVAAYDRRLRHPAWVCPHLTLSRNANERSLTDC